ncbi:NAD-dependent succinate-semialdehyde dehydrogenase [Pseudomonas corrugata]|uniref:NAD-dependent succinate-semialdehyde dehydrogenase n=1 Tax=Pseudomonas corrugata TaxID=47879 RepID=UPI0006D88AB2|nr:NAD-dependent succinate-semialdehyde dehydrogenase [Pseudomonas corrugata]
MQLKDTQLFRQQAFIDGAWVDADNGQTIKVTNPATGEVLGTVPKMGAAETGRAIEAADKALPAWRALTAKERANKLRRWYELLIENQDDLGRLMTLEQGKPLAEAKGEIVYAASFIEWFAEEAKRIYGDVIPGHQPDKRLIVIKQPIGVTAAITPWNFPAAMITRKAGPALAAGCTMVIKPASQTPFSALALVELAHRAGIPQGVLSVVTGSAGDIGGELTSNPIVRKLSFTGSTEIGRQLMAECAKDIKKVSLELGGNAPFIVCADADLALAVEVAVQAKFQTSGQDCCAANRIMVQRPLYQAFVSRFAAAVRALRVGPAMVDRQEQDVDVGPLMHQAAFDATTDRVADALALGAQRLVGGEAHALGGLFYQPTVLADVTPQMRIYREENFAPIAGVMPFDTLDEAIEMANDTEYGLAAYICSNRLDLIYPLIRRLDHAMVAVNGVKFTGHPIPFGGMKASGLGREGGSEGFEPFVETKYFCLHHQGQFPGESA